MQVTITFDPTTEYGQQMLARLFPANMPVPAAAQAAAPAEEPAKPRGRKKVDPPAPPAAVPDSTDAAQASLLANHGIPDEAPAPSPTPVAEAPATVRATGEVIPTLEAAQESAKAFVAAKGGGATGINAIKPILEQFGAKKVSEIPEAHRAAFINAVAV